MVLQPERLAVAAVWWIVVAVAVAVAESRPVLLKMVAGAAVDEGEVRRVAALGMLRVRSVSVEPLIVASSASSCSG